MSDKKLRIREQDKLRVHWGVLPDDKYAEPSFIVSWPRMSQGSSDGAWLLSHVFTEDVAKELIKRGYDISTIKFSISPKLIEPTRPERFKTLIEKYKSE